VIVLCRQTRAKWGRCSSGCHRRTRMDVTATAAMTCLSDSWPRYALRWRSSRPSAHRPTRNRPALRGTMAQYTSPSPRHRLDIASRRLQARVMVPHGRRAHKRSRMPVVRLLLALALGTGGRRARHARCRPPARPHLVQRSLYRITRTVAPSFRGTQTSFRWMSSAHFMQAARKCSQGRACCYSRWRCRCSGLV